MMPSRSARGRPLGGAIFSVEDGKGTLDAAIKISAEGEGQRPGKMRVCLSDANGKCLLEQTQILAVTGGADAAPSGNIGRKSNPLEP